MAPGTTATFNASSTYTFQTVDWAGASGTPVTLRSSASGTPWMLDITGSQLNVDFVDVQDSNATLTDGGVIATDSSNRGNNTNWVFNSGTLAATTTLQNHPAGQVTNTFSFQNKADEPLFAFTLTPTEPASTTVTLSLTNTVGVTAANLSDWRLYRDFNNNRLIDGGDTQIGGAGTFSTTSVTFNTPFLATTTQSYIITADLTDIDSGDRITMALPADQVYATSTGTGLRQTVISTVSSTNHLRSRKGGGTGSMNFINIGAVGAGIRGGGTTEAGEELGGEPNFNPPGSTGTPHNEWTSGAAGYLSDGAYTTETTAGQRQSYGTYGFNIPTGNQITGIEVKLEAGATTPAGTIEVALSWDNGVSTTTTRVTPTLTTADTIYTLGSPSDLWGRVWVPSEFANGAFGLRLIGQPTGGNTVSVDAIQVRIYHQSGGGGTGGGSGEL
jgi:hypothetical protein